MREGGAPRHEVLGTLVQSEPLTKTFLQADKYDSFDMRIEKHWTEKALKDMTERDWRIFREDFNIQFKGNTDVLPLRNWDEAKLPDELRKASEGVEGEGERVSVRERRAVGSRVERGGGLPRGINLVPEVRCVSRFPCLPAVKPLPSNPALSICAPAPGPRAPSEGRIVMPKT